MAERPILFSGAMVRAIIAGKKTQTRRVLDVSRLVLALGVERERDLPLASRWKVVDGEARLLLDKFNAAVATTRCPYGAPGDVLWCRESFSFRDYGPLGAPDLDTSECWYWADGNVPTHGNWTRPKPSIHMPRWASRLSLLVKDVRVERLQEITKADVDAEGVLGDEWYDFRDHAEACAPPGSHIQTEREYFATRWDRLYAKRAPWASNPWVWVVTFERLSPDDAKSLAVAEAALVRNAP